METSNPRHSAHGNIPATSEHQAMKAVARTDSGSASSWLSTAMAIWVQDGGQTPTARAAQERVRLPR